MAFENPKLYIGFVAEEIDEATLRQYFSEYGEVKQVLVIPNKRIAYVTFSDPLMAKNALQEEHIILGRKVDVKPAKPRTQISNRNTKIFVGGLPSTITLENFKEYFGSYGTISDAALIYDKVTHIFRGFGFVTYDSEEAAANVLRKNFHELNNKMVEVKRAKPKEKIMERNNYHDYGAVAVADQIDDIYNVNFQPVFHGGFYFYYYGVGWIWVPMAVLDGWI